MTESVALTGDYDGRISDADREPVWEKVITGTWATGETADVTQTIKISGILLKMIIDVSDATAGITGQVIINDSGDNEIFDSGEKTKNDKYNYNLYEPLFGDIDFVLGPSANPTSAFTITVTLRGV